MNKSIIFLFGSAVGAGITWLLLQKKYLRRADSEIEEIRKYYEERRDSLRQTSVSDRNIPDKPPIGNYISDDDVEGVEFVMNEPIIASPPEGGYFSDSEIIPYEEFMKNDGNTKESLTYYIGDVVLTDMWDNEVLLDETVLNADFLEIGGDELEHRFVRGEGEGDIIYIRNNLTSVDYEVVLDERSWGSTTSGEFYRED